MTTTRQAALAVQLADEAQDAAPRQDVQAERRLVQEQDLRLVQQASAEVGAHALAQAELAHQRAEDVVQAEQLAHQAEHALVARPRDVPDDALPLEARGDRMIPPQLGALAEDDADAADVAHPVAHRVHAQRADACRDRAPAVPTAA